MDALSCKWIRCNISSVLANRPKLETRPSTRPVRPCLHPCLHAKTQQNPRVYLRAPTPTLIHTHAKFLLHPYR